MIHQKVKYLASILLIISTFVSCDKGSDSDTEKQIEKPLPTKVQGTLPANGEPCSDFELVPNDDSKVSILFKWNASQNAVNYDLVVKEGAQEAAKTTVGALEASLTLDKGKTYSWTVTAKNETGNTISDTYSFTTPGQAIGNYAPYAAEITLNFNTTNHILNVVWVAEDEDGDALNYDIVVQENGSVLMEETDLSNTTIEDITYVSGTTYLVSVKAKDTSGNFSFSEKSEISPD